jgi:hypothetical protein
MIRSDSAAMEVDGVREPTNNDSEASENPVMYIRKGRYRSMNNRRASAFKAALVPEIERQRPEKFRHGDRIRRLIQRSRNQPKPINKAEDRALVVAVFVVLVVLTRPYRNRTSSRSMPAVHLPHRQDLTHRRRQSKLAAIIERQGYDHVFAWL